MTEAIQQRKTALYELEITKRELRENIEIYDRDEEEIKKLNEINMELTVKLIEALKTIDLLKSRNDALQSALEKERDENTPINPRNIPSCSITDSNKNNNKTTAGIIEGTQS